jgi:hypothetical protein
MSIRSREVDAYIASAAPFARPILKKLRELFHAACPQVEERLKWRCPSFEYKGMLGGMAAFKRHVSWGLWKAALLDDPDGILKSTASSPMGGGSPTDVSELPPDRAMLRLIGQAVRLNEQGVKLPRRSARGGKPPVRPPADLARALRAAPAARATWVAFSPSHRREYAEWILDARRPETRRRRVEQAIALLAEGKGRNWKYERNPRSRQAAARAARSG